MIPTAITAELSPLWPDPEWEELAKAEPNYPLLGHPAFSQAFAAHFDDRARIFAARLRDGAGTLRAVQPLMISRHLRHPGLVPRYDYLSGDAAFLTEKRSRVIPLRQLSPVLGLECGNLRMAGCRGDLAKEIFWPPLTLRLRRLRGWDIGIFPIEAGEFELAAASFRHAGCPAFRGRTDRAYLMREKPRPIAEIVATQSKKFRQNIRRASSEAESSGIRFDVLDGHAASDLMPAFAALGAASWKAGGRLVAEARGQALSVPYQGQQREFFETLARDPRLRPVMSVARGDDGLHAACLGFFGAGCLTTMITLHRPSSGKAGHGRLVLHELIDWAWRNGASRIDFNTTAEWPRPYADQSRDDLHLVVMRPGIYGGALALLARLRGQDG
ncbi:GNAT family N-acetyltransferase [Paracoccus ravus]|uniref:GNAT family N-acetyltransferase n=1 Tax=Paracoccus ravus TaxID=2447760 RepID=UPI00106E4600|nr:GNAT family N-acetyltransferase [Paracoccus ravus]